MKRCGLILVFVCTVVASGATLTSSVRTNRLCTPTDVPLVKAGSDEGIDPVAAAREWMGCQPRHWRACLLQHP